jgi:drug/metabolite transporter (DMT)-like permease
MVPISPLVTLVVIFKPGMRWPSGYEWMALASALCSGLALSFIRRLRKTGSPHVVFLQSMCGFILAGSFLAGAKRG